MMLNLSMQCALAVRIEECTLFLATTVKGADSFKLNHECEVMTDYEHVVFHNNATDEWEHELSVNPDYSVKDHNDWCAENNFGVNNFGLNRAVLPMTKIRCDAGLHMHCHAARKMLLCFRKFIERCNNDDEVYLCFE